ncbi:isochorismatase family protein [Paenibacillus phoenicis]|uniref:Isochorismatase family protein n=1 Tax=Paenibacillus phoenicis TaxID=554117 RepID=A0ABU5PI19_9BACL|nr:MULTISPECIES: isochorismatase family protein [Paenibacillus]MCT2194535.1 isochorismatase family protein [Paenibacillus sp. p3-SID1389]MEA3569593.1 isochorismatase family protein [Paenibacillus phoenicis]
MKPALLIIDMQQVFLNHPRIQSEIPGVCEYINAVADLFREAGRPVVVVQDQDGGVGTPGYEVIPEVKILESDLRISKAWSNSFWKTNLEELLREHDTDFVVVCGFAAEYCVTFTFNGAVERGFGAAILQKGILGEHPDSVAAVYRDRSLISYSVIRALLKQN